MLRLQHGAEGSRTISRIGQTVALRQQATHSPDCGGEAATCVRVTVYACVQKYICVRGCGCVKCEYTIVYICGYVDVRASVSICRTIPIQCANTRTHTYTDMHTCTDGYIHRHAHARENMHAHRQQQKTHNISTYTNICTCMYNLPQRHTVIKNTHKYMHINGDISVVDTCTHLQRRASAGP